MGDKHGAGCGTSDWVQVQDWAQDKDQDWEPMTAFEDCGYGVDDDDAKYWDLDVPAPRKQNTRRARKTRHNVEYRNTGPEWRKVRARLKVYIGHRDHPGSRDAWKGIKKKSLLGAVDFGWGPDDYLDHRGPYCDRKEGGGVDECNCDVSQQPLRSQDFETLRADAWKSLAKQGWGARLFPVDDHVVQQFMAHSAPRVSIVYHGTSIHNFRSIAMKGLLAGGTDIPVANGTAYGNGVYTGHSPEVSLGYSRGTPIVLACLLWHDTKAPLTAVSSKDLDLNLDLESCATQATRAKTPKKTGWNARHTHRTSVYSSTRLVKKLKKRLAVEQAAYNAALAAFTAALVSGGPESPRLPAFPKLNALKARVERVQSACSIVRLDPCTMSDTSGKHFVSSRLSVVEEPSKVIPAFYYQQPPELARQSNFFKVPQTWRELTRRHGRITVRYVKNLAERRVAVWRLRGSRDIRRDSDVLCAAGANVAADVLDGVHVV